MININIVSFQMRSDRDNLGLDNGETCAVVYSINPQIPIESWEKYVSYTQSDFDVLDDQFQNITLPMETFNIPTLGIGLVNNATRTNNDRDWCYFSNLALLGTPITISPSVAPTLMPSETPTNAPSSIPTSIPTQTTFSPSLTPTTIPSKTPSFSPLNAPTTTPSLFPTNVPSIIPTISPTFIPSISPSFTPSMKTSNPSYTPSIVPTTSPTTLPSISPTILPTLSPNIAIVSSKITPRTVFILTIIVIVISIIVFLLCALIMFMIYFRKLKKLQNNISQTNIISRMRIASSSNQIHNSPEPIQSKTVSDNILPSILTPGNNTLDSNAKGEPQISNSDNLTEINNNKTKGNDDDIYLVEMVENNRINNEIKDNILKEHNKVKSLFDDNEFMDQIRSDHNIMNNEILSEIEIERGNFNETRQ